MRVFISTLLVGTTIWANYFEFGAGVSNFRDNLNTAGEDYIHTYSKAQSESRFIPYLGFSYNFLEKFNLKSQKRGLKLSYRYSENISLGVNAEYSREYENPYLLNINRDESSVLRYGLSLGYLNRYRFLGYGVEYKFNYKDVDRDLLPDSLKRDGFSNSINFKLLYRNYYFSPIYERFEADSKASSFNRYGLSTGAKFDLNSNLEFKLFGSILKREFDSENPIFGEFSDRDEFNLFSDIKLKNIYEDIYFGLKVGYSKRDSEIDFFDSEGVLSIIYSGFKF